jgi:hypothetical protein
MKKFLKTLLSIREWLEVGTVLALTVILFFTVSLSITKEDVFAAELPSITKSAPIASARVMW